MMDCVAAETRLILCDHSGSADSFSHLLDLTFLPRDVIDRWTVARNLDEITSAIEDALGVYLKLSLWQLNDLRLEMPKAVLQILHTIAMNTDVTILTTCLRFLALIFELHSLLFSSCVDIILEKISKFIDDQRPPVQCATVNCLGVLFTNIPYRCLECYLPTILGSGGETVAGDVEEESDSRSENRLKLATISILSLNKEVVTGISTLSPESELNLANLTRNVICGTFDIDTTVDGGDYGKSYFTERRISTGNYTVQQRVISAAIDLVAASSLILCNAPFVRSALPCIERDAISSSFSCHVLPTQQTFPYEFIENILSDPNHELRVGLPVQEEILKRIVEKKLPSLDADKDLAETANSLLIFASNHDPMLSLPPVIHGSLVLCIPPFEPSDSLATTAESSSNLSGKMLTSNGTVLSPPRRFSSSNSNIPASQYAFLEDGNGSSSLDGIDSDIDRSKLSALKKSQSRGGSRSQRRGTSQSLVTSCMSPDVPDFFVVNPSEGEDSAGSRSPARSSVRSNFFAKKAASHDDFEVTETFQGHRKSRSAMTDVFRDSGSSFSPYDNFHRPSRLIGTLIEGDADADFGNNGDSEKFDLDSESVLDAIAYEDADSYGGPRAACSSSNNSNIINRNVDMSADVLSLVRESFPHSRITRTIEGNSRANGQVQAHGNFTLDRFEALDGSIQPQNYLSSASSECNGIRTHGLMHHNGNQVRLGSRSIDIAMSLAKDSKQLLASASLPGPFLSLDGLEHSHVKQGGPLFALPSPASNLKLNTDLDRSGRLRLSCDSVWDTNPTITLGPIGGHGLVKKLRTLRSPCSDLRKESSFFSSSPLSSNPISPLSLSSLSTSKTDTMSKGRDSGRFQRELEVKPRKSSVQDVGPSVQRDYQLAGETFEYLSTEAIAPCSSPQRDFMKAVQGIGSHEWPEIFHTLTTVRRLSLHHSSFLTASSNTSCNGSMSMASGSATGCALHSIVLGVLKQVDNLRSAVAKNALLTLGDLFQGLGRYMDSEVALSLTHVLKRFADSSTFLVESAERALLQMMENVSASKSLSGLLTAAEHRASTVRGKVASVLYLLWHQKLKELKSFCFQGSKDQDILKAKISKLVSDQAPEARTASRNIVRFLVLEGVVSKSEWQLCIPSNQLDKILSQSLTAPSLSGSNASGGGQRKSRSSLSSTSASTAPLYTRHMSIQMCEETSAKSKVNGGNKNRRSLGCLSTGPFLSGPSACPSTSTSLSPPMTDNASYPELIVDKDYWHDRGIRKADKGVSFAADDSSECTAQTVHSQGRRSLNLGSRSIGKAGIGVDWTSGIAGVTSSKNKEPLRSSRFLNPDVPELQCLPDLVHAAGSSTHWTERQESMKSITTLVNVHWKTLIDESKMAPVVESLLERLEDGSVKVAVCALACLQSIHESTPKALGHSTATQLAVITSLHSAASASNRLIATNAMNFLVLFVLSVPVHLTVSHVCAISLHEKERQRAVAFRVLVDMLIVHVHPQRDELLSGGFIRRHIFPTICQVLFGAASKGEVRVAAAETLRALQQVMLSSPASSFEKKNDLVSSEKFRDKESEKVRDRYNSKLYIEKVKDNDCENKVLWTWCRDTAHQEEIRRLTANSV